MLAEVGREVQVAVAVLVVAKDPLVVAPLVELVPDQVAAQAVAANDLVVELALLEVALVAPEVGRVVQAAQVAAQVVAQVVALSVELGAANGRLEVEPRSEEVARIVPRLAVAKRETGLLEGQLRAFFRAPANR